MLDEGRGLPYGYRSSLHYLASFINHSCLPNTRETKIGDLVIYRAKEDISAGTQITRSYIDRDYSSYPERREALAKYFASDCSCKLCTDDRSDGNKKIYERSRIEAECETMKKAVWIGGKPSRGQLLKLRERFEAAAKSIDKTYGPHRSRIKPELMHIQYYIRGTCEIPRDWSVEADYIEESLIAMGVVIKYRNEADLKQKRFRYPKINTPDDLCILTTPRIEDDMATSLR